MKKTSVPACRPVFGAQRSPAMPTEPLGFQVILRLDDDRVLAPSREARRKLARVMHRVGDEFGVYAWCVGDNHLHVGLFCSLAQANEFARRLAIALQRALRPRTRFDRPRITPIHDQAHARNVLFYVLGQSAHHGTNQDPFHEANSIHDLVGARVGGAWIARRVREHLPRVTRAQLLACIGLTAFDEADGDDPDAVAAAFALPALSGRDALIVRARTAAVHASARTTARLAAALAISPRNVRFHRARAPVPEDVRAVRRQFGLRLAMAARSTLLVAQSVAIPAEA